ncbi:hypothetical protein C8Q70DRAFT_1057106 [Cubamyces menziesii]|nr:hypothetical protein C8Q70DRAFT_1057106 [Cubamyces menziesii]
MQREPVTTPIAPEAGREIFVSLEEARKSLCQFANTHSRSTGVVRPRYARSARITSTEDRETALRILSSNASRAAALHTYVVEWDIHGRVPGRAGKPWLKPGEKAPTSMLPPRVLPNLCALRIRCWESQYIEKDFLGALYRLGGITELHLHHCTFKTSESLSAILFSLPELAELTLDSVTWSERKPGCGPPDQFTSPPWCAKHALALRTLRIRSPCNSGPFFRWLVEQKCVNVQNVELTMFDEDNGRYAAWYLQHLGNALQTLVCGLCPRASGRSPEGDWLHLHYNPNLRALSIAIYDALPHYSNWIHKALASATRCPLASVSFSLSLGHHETLWSKPWEAVHNLLTTNWTSTLREVAVTHHAHWQFVADATPLFTARFPGLAARGILSVYNVETEDSITTRPGTYQ